jgi:hypothetical protein
MSVRKCFEADWVRQGCTRRGEIKIQDIKKYTPVQAGLSRRLKDQSSCACLWSLYGNASPTFTTCTRMVSDRQHATFRHRATFHSEHLEGRADARCERKKTGQNCWPWCRDCPKERWGQITSQPDHWACVVSVSHLSYTESQAYASAEARSRWMIASCPTLPKSALTLGRRFHTD